MPSKQVVFALVTFLHDLFTVLWIGGLATLGIVVLPAARQVFGPGGELRKLIDAVQRRLSWVVYASMVGLILTGILLSRRSPSFTGLFQTGNLYSLVLTIKHVFVIAMVGIGLYRRLALVPRRGPADAAREKRSMALIYLNLALGVIVLLLSGFSAALASALPMG